jgi:hypothetical protein
VEAVDGTADLVIKPMTALPSKASPAPRVRPKALVLVVGLSFLMDGCRSTVRLAASPKARPQQTHEKPAQILRRLFLFAARNFLNAVIKFA